VHGAPAQFGGELDGAFVGTIGDDNAVGTAAEERAGGFLAGLAGADDHDLAVAEIGEDLLASSTATEPTEMLPRWMLVSVRICLGR